MKLLSQQAENANDWSVDSISVTGTGGMAPTYSMGALQLYVMYPDQKSVRNAKRTIQEYRNP